MSNPPVVLYNKYSSKEIYAGSYPNFTIYLSDVDGMYVPPIYEVYLYDSFNQTGRSIKYTGGSHKLTGIVSSVKVVQIDNWTDTQLKCCLSDPSVNSDSCGVWWGKNPTVGCDVVVNNYCKLNPSDPKCACYILPDTTNSKLRSALNARPDCFVSDCSIHGYIPSTIYGKQCPALTICEQDMSSAGTSNIIKDNVQIMKCGDSTNTSEDQQTADNTKKSSIYVYVLLLFILLITVVVTYVQPYQSNNIYTYHNHDIIG